MIQINLLPVRVQKKKEGARQLASIYLLTVCLAVAVIFTVIGSFFRGPNWSWVEPWRNPPAMTEGH